MFLSFVGTKLYNKKPVLSATKSDAGKSNCILLTAFSSISNSITREVGISSTYRLPEFTDKATGLTYSLGPFPLLQITAIHFPSFLSKVYMEAVISSNKKMVSPTMQTSFAFPINWFVSNCNGNNLISEKYSSLLSSFSSNSSITNVSNISSLFTSCLQDKNNIKNKNNDTTVDFIILSY